MALAEAPAGSALQEILHGVPGRKESAPLLEDDRLHEYQFEGGNLLWWQPDGRLLEGEQVSGLAFSGPLPEIHSAGMLVPGDEGVSRVSLRFPVNDPARASYNPVVTR